MSNERIADRLQALAAAFELGELSVQSLATQLAGHAAALEAMDYRKIKEAQQVKGQLLLAVQTGREGEIDRQTLLAWLRHWILAIPNTNP